MKTILTISPRNDSHTSGLFRVALTLNKYTSEYNTTATDKVRSIPCTCDMFSVLNEEGLLKLFCQHNNKDFEYILEPKDTVVIIRGGVLRYREAVSYIQL
jgi:hypothetical protein